MVWRRPSRRRRPRRRATPCEEAEPYDYVVLMRRPFFCDRRGRLRSLHVPSTHDSRGDGVPLSREQQHERVYTTSTPSTRLPRRRRASPSARGGPGGRRSAGPPSTPS